MRSASAYSFVCAISAPSSSQLPGRSGATRSACAFAAIAFSTALSWADFEDFAAAAVFAPKPPPDEAARFGFFAAFTFAFARAAAEEEPMRTARRRATPSCRMDDLQASKSRDEMVTR